jgi:DNA-binding response OmpR family regulator
MAKRVPDLVILDDDLPDGRGGDRARELRDDRRLRDVPVLVCTAAPPLRQAEIGTWVPVVNKPFDLGEIERILQAAARRRGLEVDRAAG